MRGGEQHWSCSRGRLRGNGRRIEKERWTSGESVDTARPQLAEAQPRQERVGEGVWRIARGMHLHHGGAIEKVRRRTGSPALAVRERVPHRRALGLEPCTPKSFEELVERQVGEAERLCVARAARRSARGHRRQSGTDLVAGGELRVAQPCPRGLPKKPLRGGTAPQAGGQLPV